MQRKTRLKTRLKFTERDKKENAIETTAEILSLSGWKFLMCVALCAKQNAHGCYANGIKFKLIVVDGFSLLHMCSEFKNPSTAISLNFIYYTRLWLCSVRLVTVERIRARVSEWRALYTFHADRLLTATTRRYSFMDGTLVRYTCFIMRMIETTVAFNSSFSRAALVSMFIPFNVTP